MLESDSSLEAPTRVGLYHKIKLEEPQPLRKLNKAVARDLAVICERSKEKNPDRRYQTALDLAEDLRRFRSFEPIHARPVGLLTRFLRFTQRSPVVANLSAALVLFLASGFVWTAIKNSELDTLNLDLDAQNRALAQETTEAEFNSRQANLSATEARNRETEALANLAEARRMADVKLVAEAKAALDELWPLGGTLLSRIEQFNSTYGALIDRLDIHEAAQRELESSALPYDETSRRADHAATFDRLANLETEIDKLKVELATDPPVERIEDVKTKINAKAKERTNLETQVSKRKSWRFSRGNCGIRRVATRSA